MTWTTSEIASQPEAWASAVAAAKEHRDLLPSLEARVLVVGCGTSLHIGRAWARARASTGGAGASDARPASELTPGTWDLALCISRSGTTSEVLWAARELARTTPTLGITAVPDSPLARVVDESIVLDFADERSIVQTRWATSVLALLRAHIGHDVLGLTPAAATAVAGDLPVDPSGFSRFVFVGRGWAAALADEAALKLREGAGAWSESYPAMEYRHGPMSVSRPPTLFWSLGSLDPDLRADVEQTGATVVASDQDPMVELIGVQRAAVVVALHRGLNPDAPEHLSRSVVLA